MIRDRVLRLPPVALMTPVVHTIRVARTTRPVVHTIHADPINPANHVTRVALITISTAICASI
jgi:hypothetical protein